MDSESKNSDEDIQTDAQPETDDISVASSAGSIHSDLSGVQSARPIRPPEEEYLNYICQMPPDLQEDNIDILIIHADKDIKAATDFRDHLKKDIVFYIHNHQRVPRVKLLKEVHCGAKDQLDFAFCKSLYVFLFVTKEFCADHWTLLQGSACLTEAVNDPNKRWCIVPVHTASKKNQKYKLPMMLNCLRPINYFSGRQDQFYVEGVRKLLESKTELLLDSDRKLDERRRKKFRENFAKYVKNVPFAPMRPVATRCSPVVQSYNAKEELTSIPSSRAVYETGVQRYSQSDDHCDKAVLEVVATAVTDGMEGLAISEQEPLPQNNSLQVVIKNSTPSSSEQLNQGEPQQPESLDIHIGGSSVEHHEPNTVFTAKNNNNVESAQQGASAANFVIDAGEESSIVVDGLVYENSFPPSAQQNVPLSNQNQTLPNRASIAAQGGNATCTQAKVRYSESTNAPQSTYQLGCGFPGYVAYFHNTSRPMFIPVHPRMPAQLLQRNSISYPHLIQYPSQPYQSLPPTDMEALYSYANPIPCQQGYFPYHLEPYSQTESASDIESSQLSTEAHAPNSLRSGLSHSSSADTLGSLNFSPGINSQNPLPHQLQTWNSAFFQPQPLPDITSHHPAFSRHHMATTPTNPTRQLQSHIQCPDQQEDTGAGSRPFIHTMPFSGNSAETPGGNSSTASSVIQHIHHHHHTRNITVAQATNVLVGDKSKFMTKSTSSHEVDDGGNSDDNGNEDDAQRVTPGSSRAGGQSFTSRYPAANESQRRRLAESGNLSDRRRQNSAGSMGFAECLSPVSSREPVEVSEIEESPDDDERHQMYTKELCNLSYILNK